MGVRQRTQDVCGCLWLSVSTHRTSVAVRVCPCVSVGVRQHTQDVRGCQWLSVSTHSVVVPTTEVPIIRKGPTTRSGSRVIRAGFAKAVQELLAQEQTGFKQLLIQELSDLKLEDTGEPLEVPDPFHSSQFSSIGQSEAGLTISTFMLNPSNQLASGSEI